MPLLMELDEVSYIRFASVYREFQSRDMFLKELEAMQKSGMTSEDDSLSESKVGSDQSTESLNDSERLEIEENESKA